MEISLYYFPSSCTFLHSWNSVQEFQFFLIFSNACYFLFVFFFESSHLNGREIFIFQSMTLTYLYFINVILGPIPAVLFYVFNVLCLFPDSLHPFPIFCWVDWGFLFFFFVLFYFISLKTWKLQRTKLHVLTLLVFGTLEFGDTILLRYNMNM